MIVHKIGALSGIGIKRWRPKSSPIGANEEVKEV